MYNGVHPLSMRRERRYDWGKLLVRAALQRHGLALHTYIKFHFGLFTAPGKHNSKYIVEGDGRTFEHISEEMH